MTEEEYELAKKEVAVWKKRQAATLTRIRKESKKNNEPVYITYEKMRMIRAACIGEERLISNIKDVENNGLEIKIKIDKLFDK